MEAIRDQRGSVLSYRRTHKGLDLHNLQCKLQVKCVRRKFQQAICIRFDRFVHESMESPRILIPMVHVKKDSSTGEMFTGVRFSGSVILCKLVESRLKCMEEELL